MIGFNVCYAEGAPGFCTNNNVFAVYEQQHQRGPWLDRRRRLRQRHPSRAHQGVERSCRVRAHLEPEMAHLVRRRLRQRRLRQRCHQPDPAAHPGRVGAPAASPADAGPTLSTVQLLPGNSCSPDYGFWEAGTRTQWNPVPQLDIGLEVLYSKRNTAFKGAAIVPAANGRGPPVLALDDQSVWSAMFRWQRNFYP